MTAKYTFRILYLTFIFANLNLASPIPLLASALQCQDVPQIFELYLKNHYAFHKMTESIKLHTAEQFIKDLDPSKTLLLEQDANKLRKDIMHVFSTMEVGDCASMKGISQLLMSRAKDDKIFVENYLGKNYKLDQSVTLVINPDKRHYPRTTEEREALLVKMIHFQISNYLLTGIELQEAKRNLIHRYELNLKRVKERKEEDWVTAYLEAFASSLDPHSSFLSQDNLEDFQIQMRLSLEGIGASLASRDGFTEIEEIIAGGGADRSKILRPKDKIIAVAEEGKKSVSVIDMELREVVKLIRGAKDTKVTLTVLRQGKKVETFDVTIARDKIDIKDQAASISFEQHKVSNKTINVGIIDLPSFYGDEEGGRSSSKDIRKLIEEAKTKKVDGIVLDLSRNGGGLLQEAVKISGLFIKKGGVVATRDVDGKLEILASENDQIFYSGPLVVLTSHLSASASEILAGALQTYNRALIVGTDRTFGKGTVQNISGLPLKLGALKITIGMFFIPNGESTQYRGVIPDIQFPSNFGDKEIGERAMNYSLPSQKILPFLSKEANSIELTNHWAPLERSRIKILAVKSKQRVSKDVDFIKLQKDIAENLKNKNIIRLSEIQKTVLEKKDK